MYGKKKKESNSLYERIVNAVERKAKKSKDPFVFDDITDEFISEFSKSDNIVIPKELASVRPRNLNKIKDFVLTLDKTDQKRSDKFGKFLVALDKTFHAVANGYIDSEDVQNEKLSFNPIFN